MRKCVSYKKFPTHKLDFAKIVDQKIQEKKSFFKRERIMLPELFAGKMSIYLNSPNSIFSCLARMNDCAVVVACYIIEFNERNFFRSLCVFFLHILAGFSIFINKRKFLFFFIQIYYFFLQLMFHLLFLPIF